MGKLVISLLLFLVLATALSGCFSYAAELPGVEVREYQGEDLSSIN